MSNHLIAVGVAEDATQPVVVTWSDLGQDERIQLVVCKQG